MRVSWMSGKILPGEHVNEFEGGGGRLGLCCCPGKRLKKPRPRAGHEEAEGPIMRDMRADCQQLAGAHGVTMIVCLLNDYELRSIGVDSKAFPAIVRACQMEFVQFPIIEGTAPTEGIAGVQQVIAQAREETSRGGRVAVHCRGGVGRAGMLAACYLLQTGEARTSKQAIALVRKRRCKQAVETRRQEDFVVQYSKWLKEDAKHGGGRLPAPVSVQQTAAHTRTVRQSFSAGAYLAAARCSVGRALIRTLLLPTQRYG